MSSMPPTQDLQLLYVQVRGSVPRCLPIAVHTTPGQAGQQPGWCQLHVAGWDLSRISGCRVLSCPVQCSGCQRTLDDVLQMVALREARCIFRSCPTQGLLRTVTLFCKYKILKIWRQPPWQRVRKLQRRWCELIRADIKLPRLELSPRWIWIRTADKEAALGELAFGAGLD